MQLAAALLRPAWTDQVTPDAWQDIGTVIRASRHRLGLRQIDAAREVQISHRLWSEVETGKRPGLKAATLFRMLGFLGLRVELRHEAPR